MTKRNFWIEACIDGRKPKLEGGPQGKTGGFHLLIKQRDEGHVATVAMISGDASPDGHLSLTIRALRGCKLAIVASVDTER